MDTTIIGSKIAEARKKINISQAQLGERLFISQQAVGKWERGESLPDITTFNRLAKILGVDLNYFSEDFGAGDGGTAPVLAKADESQEAEPQRRLLTKFNGSSLSESDFAGITAHKQQFKGSALRGSSFANADLTGSYFMGSDIAEANFDGANLTDCKMSANDLTNASFHRTILVRTVFSSSGLAGAKFTDAKLENVRMSATDLRNTVFENCIFIGVEFKSSDLSGLCFDGQTFVDVSFDKTALNNVSFKGTTLKNVSFRSPFAITNKYYRALQTICFDEAKMDKLTYAALKGLGVDLSNVTTI